MSGYDATTDPLIDALRVVVRRRVNRALASDLGSTYDDATGLYTAGAAIIDAIGYPVPLAQIDAMRLPLVAIHRTRTNVVARGRRHDRRSIVQLQYWAPPTPLAKLSAHWSLLHNVGEAMLDAILDGSDPVTGDELLCEAGVTEVDEDTWSITYAFASDEGLQYAYPVATAQVAIDWRPVSTETAVWLLTLACDIDLHANGNPVPVPAGDPIVQIEVDGFTGHGSGFDSGFGAPTNG